MPARTPKHQSASIGARGRTDFGFFRNIIGRLGSRWDAVKTGETSILPSLQQSERSETQHLGRHRESDEGGRVSSHTADTIGPTTTPTPTIFSHHEHSQGRNQGLSQQASEASGRKGSAITLAIPESLGRPRSGYAETSHLGFLANASNCNFHNTVMNLNYHDQEYAIKSLESYAIRGAEFDSADRSPPPKCHPGTRKTIVERAQSWFCDVERQKKILWFVGSAGGGKSAVMQTLAEHAAASPDLMLGATLFFSRPNGRNDPSTVFITLACQIAIACPPYREFVIQEVISNPRLPMKSMETQFARLIVEPFVQRRICQGSSELLIFLDGLDECEGERAQCEIVELISSFSLAHPDTPLIWIIASRPESHLQAVFSRKSIVSSFVKEEVPIDSDEACADVEKYLRKEFERIQQDDPILRLQPYWPTEGEFLTIAAAAGGLFAFASTAIKFVDDPTYGNPVSGLALLLAAIKKVSLQSSKGRSHPLAHLDVLYSCILSAIPSVILPDAILLLTNYLVLGNVPDKLRNPTSSSLAFLCNWVGMSSHDAYSALRRLHSVLTIPPPEEADVQKSSFHHQSFYEYLKDPDRSQRFYISVADMDKQEVECSLRILKEAHLGAATENDGPPAVSNVVLSWSTAESSKIREVLYERATWSISGIIDRYGLGLVLPKLQDPEVIQVIRTINLVDPRTRANNNCRRGVEFLRHIQYQLDPQLQLKFEDLNLLWTVRLRTIDLGNVDKKGWMYACCERNIDGKVRLGTALSTPCGPFPIDYESEYRQWWCTNPTNFDRHKERILHDLRTRIAQTPDVPVVLFGNVTRTHLMYEYKTPDGSERWTHYVPYRFP